MDPPKHPTHDPRDPQYLDEAAVRSELTRVFDICHECRRCVELCPVFPTLFDLIARTTDRQAGLLTPSDQDDVVDGCFHCNRCSADCPYTAELHPAAVDVPRLVLRATAMRASAGQMPILHGLTAGAAAQADGLRLLADPFGARTGGQSRQGWRAATARISALSPIRLPRPSVRQRFSAWFAGHTPSLGAVRRGAVVLVPTCLVEYQQPDVARDLVGVYERLGIECSVSRVGCCGAPWLHTGDRDRFTRMARGNVRSLAADLRRGRGESVVVAEATCRSVMRREYVAAVGDDARADAVFVTSRLTDPASHLLDVHRREGDALFADLVADEVTQVVVHRSCHDRDDESADSTAELLSLLDVDAVVVDGCAAVGGRWGAAVVTEAHRSRLHVGLVASMDAAVDAGADAAVDEGAVAGVDAAVVEAPSNLVAVGGCGLANRVVGARSTFDVVHPMTFLARRFGVGSPPDASHE